jgi:beta-glucanase (GH16 family)
LNRYGDGGNNELQCYTPANVNVSGGSLNILTKVESKTCGTSTQGSATYSYTSGMVQWTNFNFTFGTLEYSAKFAGGTGPWSAVWLLGSNCQGSNINTPDNVGSCNWPTTGSNEVDVSEILNGNMSDPTSSVFSTAGTPQKCDPYVSDVSATFHVYKMVWTSSSITLSIDGNQMCQFTSNIPQTPMFLIMNTALSNQIVVPNNATLPQTMQVQYVKVSQP